MKTLSTLLILVFSADQILGRTTSTGDAGMSCFLSVSNLQHSGKGTNPDTYYKLSVNGEYIRGSKKDVRRDMKASLWQFDLDSVLEDSDIIEVVWMDYDRGFWNSDDHLGTSTFKFGDGGGNFVTKDVEARNVFTCSEK